MVNLARNHKMDFENKRCTFGIPFFQKNWNTKTASFSDLKKQKPCLSSPLFWLNLKPCVVASFSHSPPLLVLYWNKSPSSSHHFQAIKPSPSLPPSGFANYILQLLHHSIDCGSFLQRHGDIWTLQSNWIHNKQCSLLRSATRHWNFCHSECRQSFSGLQLRQAEFGPC